MIWMPDDNQQQFLRDYDLEVICFDDKHHNNGGTCTGKGNGYSFDPKDVPWLGIYPPPSFPDIIFC